MANHVIMSRLTHAILVRHIPIDVA